MLLFLGLALWISISLTGSVIAQTDRARYLASGDTVRGVNLGGWLLTERW